MGFAQCASEGDVCAVTVVGDVIYGAGTAFTAPQVFAADTPCSNAVFGDPIVGTAKTCWYRMSPVVVPKVDPPAPLAKLWVRIAVEGGPLEVKETTAVRYGADVRYALKVLAPGAYVCNSALFDGDPAPGREKTCEKQVEVAPMPPMADHSGHGPQINNALIPPAMVGFDGPRVRSTWFNPTTFVECEPFAEGCVVSDHEKINASDIGAFREPCGFSHMAYDDPIVYPGQPGKAHLHTFFGNTGLNAFTTPESIQTGNSTCAGGTLNRSSYWMPSVIDTRYGQPIAPPSILAYYKGTYFFDMSSLVEPVPIGLRMISGSAKNTDPATSAAKYICFGPAGENPGHSATIPDAIAKGTCKPGGSLQISVAFPHCWDGVNLDSPNHASHMAYPEQDQTPPFAFHCPATHPRVLPNMSFNVGYPIRAEDDVSAWRLSSDMDPTAPAGVSGHADYFFGWNPETNKTWTKNCLTNKQDGHAYLLCDGRTLF